MKYWALMENTLLKEYRNKFLIFLFVITIVLILIINSFLNYLDDFAGLFPRELLADKKLFVFYYIINSWNAFLAIILGINTFRSDFRDGIIQNLLSFPINRTWFLALRIVSSSAIVIFYYLLSLFLALAVFSLNSEGQVYINPGLFWALIPNILLILATLTLSALLSLFFGKIPSFISSFMLVVVIKMANVGLANSFLPASFKWQEIPSFLINLLLPHIGVLNNWANDLMVNSPLSLNLWFELFHYILSLGLVFIFLNWALRKKEF